MDDLVGIFEHLVGKVFNTDNLNIKVLTHLFCYNNKRKRLSREKDYL